MKIELYGFGETPSPTHGTFLMENCLLIPKVCMFYTIGQ
jgi:hypothetical protein